MTMLHKGLTVIVHRLSTTMLFYDGRLHVSVQLVLDMVLVNSCIDTARAEFSYNG